MSKNVYKSIFEKLQKIGILDGHGEMRVNYMKFASPGMMDLSVDRLWNDNIAIAHNGKQNGDVMADPDMEIKIFPVQKAAEALTFKNDYVGIYQEVYGENGECSPRLKKDLNNFLNYWLENIIDQKYVKVEEE